MQSLLLAQALQDLVVLGSVLLSEHCVHLLKGA